MSYSVNVLLTDGHRQRIPVKLNTPILMILEETCKKRKLNSDEYDLKFHNRILDLTSTVQFCGIANNAQLELVPAIKSRIDTPVTIFLQLENGTRLSGSFLPSCTLWDIILKLCSEDIKIKENPVIIYTRQEVIGEKLKLTSLKMLGLTGGNALLRLLHRTEDQLRNQSVSSVYKLQHKPKLIITEEKVEAEKPKLENVSKINTESKSNVIQTEIQEDNKNNSSKNVNVEPSVIKMDVADEQINIYQNIMEETKLIVEEKTDDDVSTSDKMESDFDINKVKYIGERYALVFHVDSMQSPRFNDPIDDDEFYELTVEDAKKLLRDLKRTRSELEQAYLETSETKARKKSMLLERTLSTYPHCVVRILFPNRIVLQGIFKSTEIVLDVINFTKLFIETSILEFYLYISPPKKILKPQETLLNIGAIPGINLYFGCDQVEHSPTDSFLQQHFLDNMVSPNMALRVANYFRRTGGIRRNEQQMPVTPPTGSTPVISNNTSFVPKMQKKVAGEKVPKWFKMHK